jgi:hypothetical protein
MNPAAKPIVKPLPCACPHAPNQNRLLACLSAEDYQRLLPDLEPIPIRPLPDRAHPLAVFIKDGMS